MKQPLIALVWVLSLGCQRASSEAKPLAAASPEAAPAAASASAVPPAASTAMPDEPQAASAPVKPVPVALPDVVARVNGEDIKKIDFERALKNLEARAGGSVPVDRRDQILRGLLDQLVSYRLLVQESRTRHIDVTDAELDARVALIRKQFPSEDEFSKALSTQSKSLADVRVETRDNLAVEKMMKTELEPKIKIGEADIADFYKQNPQQFQEPEGMRASHILIQVEQNADEAKVKAARARIDDILAKVTGGGDFAALAKQYSQDGSAPQGGDLGFFTKGQMVPEFEQAAFALEPGKVSGVVRSPFGFHIIKATEKRGARVVPLPEVSERIGQLLGQRAQQQLTQQFVATLKAKGKVEILI